MAVMGVLIESIFFGIIPTVLLPALAVTICIYYRGTEVYRKETGQI
jgi:hypothetical protein